MQQKQIKWKDMQWKKMEWKELKRLERYSAIPSFGRWNAERSMVRDGMEGDKMVRDGL